MYHLRYFHPFWFFLEDSKRKVYFQHIDRSYYLVTLFSTLFINCDLPMYTQLSSNSNCMNMNWKNKRFILQRKTYRNRGTLFTSSHSLALQISTGIFEHNRKTFGNVDQSFSEISALYFVFPAEIIPRSALMNDF